MAQQSHKMDMKKQNFSKLNKGSWFPFLAIAIFMLWFIWPIPYFVPHDNDEVYPLGDKGQPPPPSQDLPASSITKSPSKDEFKVDSKGFWVGLGATQGHIFDSKLAAGLIYFFQKENVSTILELGAGLGQYSRALQAQGIFTSCYDGNPNTQDLTEGYCGIIDLSKPIALAKHEWVLSLEVGEHIPRQFEGMFINNLDSGNKKGIVLSWAVEGQTGTGHINTRNNTYIRWQMEMKGYTPDLAAEKLLRGRANYGWFKNSLMVFRKTIQLS